MTLDVTVLPDETSELADRGSPDQNHCTFGLGRPEKRHFVSHTKTDGEAKYSETRKKSYY